MRIARSAFTLIELLVVMAILGLLATLVGPSIVSVFQGSALTQGGQMVQDQLTYYRQYAVANNVALEVRFYTFKDPALPNDTGHYRGLQAFGLTKPTLGTSGTFTYSKVPIGKALRLPPSIIMDSGAGGATALSPLLYYATQSGGPTAPGATDPQLFDVGKNYSYAAYQILPDGSTNLPYATDGTWSFYITLHLLSFGDGLTKPPVNYFTVQVDPIDGHIFFYRP